VSTLLADSITERAQANCEEQTKESSLIESNPDRLLFEIELEAKRYMNEHCYIGHDFSHVLRVRKLCNIISEAENADKLILNAAALLHDLGRDAERKDPAADHAEKSAEIAKSILQKIGFPSDKIPAVLYAIKVHRFSKGESPNTLEAKILQDADRIDISGALGIATTFAYSGAHNRDLYEPQDPFAEKRSLDDKNYALDHFYTKLLNLPRTMHTKTGRQLAEKRALFTQLFLKELKNEICGQT
jgi:uncharacterized protein